MIASSTDSHAELIELAAKTGKAIFCEEPIDLDIGGLDRCLGLVNANGVPLMLGFNRRFDRYFLSLQQSISAGDIGRLETLTITSRDPSLPTAAYIKRSGRLFKDMMIHDFDMARWLLAEEPIQVFATGSSLVDSQIGELGDINIVIVTLKTASGWLCVISNNRRSVYGYDQRVEAFGSEDMTRVGDERATTVEMWKHARILGDKMLHFFRDRYSTAYRREIDEFVQGTRENRVPSVSGHDGRAALRLANAALESFTKVKLVLL